MAAYFTMVSGTATTAKGFYETIKGPTYDNLGDLDMKIDQATGTLKRIAAGRKSTTAKHVKKAKKELDPVTKSYSKSLAKAEVKHGNLVKKINKLLDATEKLKKKKLKKATRKKIAKAEKKINAVIAATADLGEVLRDGKRSYKDARALSKKLTETEKAMARARQRSFCPKSSIPTISTNWQRLPINWRTSGPTSRRRPRPFTIRCRMSPKCSVKTPPRLCFAGQTAGWPGRLWYKARANPVQRIRLQRWQTV